MPRQPELETLLWAEPAQVEAFVARMRSYDRQWWADRDAGAVALLRMLQIEQQHGHHQILAAMVLDAVDLGHPMHPAMRELRRWYRERVLQLVTQGEAGGSLARLTKAERATRVTRGLAVWTGLMVFRSLLPLNCPPEAFAAAVIHAATGAPPLDIISDENESHLVFLPNFPHPTDQQRELIVTMNERSIDSDWHPRGLRDAARMLDRPLKELQEVFTDSDGLVTAVLAFHGEVIDGASTIPGRAPQARLESRYAAHSRLFGHHRGMMRMHVGAYSPAMAPESPLRGPVIDRQSRAQLRLRELLTLMRRSGRLREDLPIPTTALLLHAMWLGLGIQDLYEPGSVDVGVELRAHALANLVPSHLEPPHPVTPARVPADRVPGDG